MWPLTLFVPGHPRAYGSKVADVQVDWKRRKITRRGVRESSKYVAGWKKEVTATMEAMLAGPWAPHADVHLPLIDRGQAVDVTFWFFIPTPKKVEHAYPVNKSGDYSGDWDKMARAVGDCGSDAGLWWDDCQIVDGRVRQRWADHGKYVGQEPGVLIAFRPVDEEG